MSETKAPAAAGNSVQDHLRRYLATDGADGHLYTTLTGDGPFPTLLLTTRGRRTGKTSTMPVTYGRSGKDYVLIASNAGKPAHPGWCLNLMADPAVGVQVLADRFSARARLAGGEERARLWTEMTALFPQYLAYQRKTSRELPVVVLERAG